jgi:two-component system, NarL family, nitrate/nitrite response regulator NarL
MSSVTLSSSGSSRKVRVFIADRNLLSRQLLAEVLSRDPRFHVTVVGDEAELTAAAAKSLPDVAVLSSDFGSGTDSGMRITRCFNQRYPGVRLIILMEEPSRDAVLDAFRCGASGVFSRTKPVNEFLTCIDRVSQGEIWASRGELDYLLTSLRGMPGSRMAGCENMSVLSKRELEVVKLAAEGHTNKEIADDMRLSEHTVKNYLFRACDKIGVSSRGIARYRGCAFR